IEINPRMQTSLSEMSVEGAAITETIQQLTKIAEVSAELFRRYGRILPAFPSWFLTGHQGGRTQTGLTNFPDKLFLFAIIVQSMVRRIRLTGQLFEEILRTLVRLVA